MILRMIPGSVFGSEEMSAAYIQAYRSGRLKEARRRASRWMKKCTLCPRMCRVDRTAGETGFCRTGKLAVVASYGPHYGEEPPLVGTGGSGTVFFTHCNLSCVFCQNYDISHGGEGTPVSAGRPGRNHARSSKKGLPQHKFCYSVACDSADSRCACHRCGKGAARSNHL